MAKVFRIGTRESQLAVWQASFLKNLLEARGHSCELIYITSDGDIDIETPLYEMGVEGVFTRNLDSALLNKRIDIAVHSMKDVPTQLPQSLMQSAVLKRGSYKDILVYKGDIEFLNENGPIATIATSSIRRKAQWLHRYPNHIIKNLRGNVNTRLGKLEESNWNGAIFAAAGLDRINLRPVNSVELDWMLPAPAQGAIMIVCRQDDPESFKACEPFNDPNTALCTKIERDFLRALLGGCSTPISALAEMKSGQIYFKGNILSNDGKEKVQLEKIITSDSALEAGTIFAEELVRNGGQRLVNMMIHAGK